MPSLFQEHKARWADCRRCSLCAGRRQVVTYRGKLPADIVFVAEAPGDAEDALGEVLIGPAGRFFDKMVLDRIQFGDLRWCLVNLVGCYPTEAKKTPDHRPSEEAIRACAPRLCELVAIANPRLIVTVGALAAEWLDPSKATAPPSHRRRLYQGAAVNDLYPFVYRIPSVAIRHPAALLPGRMNTAQSTLEARRCVVVVQTAIMELLNESQEERQQRVDALRPAF